MWCPHACSASHGCGSDHRWLLQISICCLLGPAPLRIALLLLILPQPGVFELLGLVCLLVSTHVIKSKLAWSRPTEVYHKPTWQQSQVVAANVHLLLTAVACPQSRHLERGLQNPLVKCCRGCGHQWWRLLLQKLSTTKSPLHGLGVLSASVHAAGPVRGLEIQGAPL